MRDPARILVVDDVADNVEILRMRLRAPGLRGRGGDDGEQALASIAADLPDLVLLDIMMPKIDGLEVVRRLKADKTPALHSGDHGDGQDTPKDVVAGLDAGGDDYLTKPIDHGALIARVRSMLRIKALHDEVQALNQGLRGQGQGAGRGARARRTGCAASWRRSSRRPIVSAGDEKVLEQPSPRDRRHVLRPARLHRRSPRPPSPRTSCRCWPSITARSAR